MVKLQIHPLSTANSIAFFFLNFTLTILCYFFFGWEGGDSDYESDSGGDVPDSVGVHSCDRPHHHRYLLHVKANLFLKISSCCCINVHCSWSWWTCRDLALLTLRYTWVIHSYYRFSRSLVSQSNKECDQSVVFFL